MAKPTGTGNETQEILHRNGILINGGAWKRIAVLKEFVDGEILGASHSVEVSKEVHELTNMARLLGSASKSEVIRHITRLLKQDALSDHPDALPNLYRAEDITFRAYYLNPSQPAHPTLQDRPHADICFGYTTNLTKVELGIGECPFTQEEEWVLQATVEGFIPPQVLLPFLTWHVTTYDNNPVIIECEAARVGASAVHAMYLFLTKRGYKDPPPPTTCHLSSIFDGRVFKLFLHWRQDRGKDLASYEMDIIALASVGIPLELEVYRKAVQDIFEWGLNKRMELMMLLLEQRGADVVVTEDVVKAAAGNEGSGKEVIMLLLEQRGADVVITEDVVKAAAGNRWSGKEVMMLLLEQRGADVVVTEDVVKAAAGNEGSGKEVIMLLLEQRGADVVVTEEVVKAAAGNRWSGKEVMMLLLEQRGADVVITEEVVKAAAGNEESGEEVITLLLDQRGSDVVIADETVKAAATCGQEKVLKLFEGRLEISTSKNKWLIAQFYNAAKRGKDDAIQRLLAEGVKPDFKNIRHVSPLWIAAANGHLKVVQTLLSTKLVDVNSQSISRRPPIFWAAASGYQDIVRLLLQAGADASLIDKDGKTPLLIAKQNGHVKIAKLLAGK